VLSQRRQEITMLAAYGFDNKRIAFELGMTEAAVKLQIHDVLQKLGMKRRTELLALLLDADMLYP
jgi:two-component system, NarL family, nitrate/nitrite response regulator NarL